MFDVDIFWSALYGWPLAKGALITIVLTLGVMAVSLVASMVTGLLITSPRRWLRRSLTFYVWLFRGAPALLVLLFIWNGLPQLIPAFRDPWFSPFLAAFIALTLIEVAYLTEIFRGAFSSIPRGQSEGAAALGLHNWQAFALVILPQAMRNALPSIVNEMISLVKSTSLATIISLPELMTVTQFAISSSFRFIEWYCAVLIYYMVIVSVLTVIQMRIETMLSRADR